MTLPRPTPLPLDAAGWPGPAAGPPEVPGFRGELAWDQATRQRFAEASGILQALPAGVAAPRDRDDVALLVRWARERRLALVPRGAGTGMPGGNVGSGIAVDLVTHFRSAPVIDDVARTARVSPGTTLAELNAAAAPHGLHFPVDPSSAERCTLGGMIANDSGGSHGVLYGSTRAWVEALECVLGDGQVVETGRGEVRRAPALQALALAADAAVGPHRAALLERWPRLRKNSSGYALREFWASGDALDLLVGSEGTLALVTAATRTARVSPGTTLAELNAAAAPHGLHFPVDPSSAERCTLGGMIANNSGGSHGVLYGSARAWVEALECVLGDGQVVETRRGEVRRAPALEALTAVADAAVGPHRAALLEHWPRLRKNSSGYALREYWASGDALDLLVGSEGTLALVTAATLRLAPLPACRGLALLEFGDLERAGAAVEAILTLRPSTCEMVDRTFIDLVRSGGGDPGYPLREGLEAILFVEVEGPDQASMTAKLTTLREMMEPVADRISIAADAESSERFWHVRHAASPLIARLAGERISMQFIEDGVVPVDRLADYIRLLRRVLAAHALPAVIFGHAGDGNLHVNPLVDVGRDGWREELEEVLREVAEGIAGLGGTLTGEHGDGRLRAPLLETIWGAEAVGCFRAVKEAFDPAGILNPGVILPLPGQRPLDAIRY